jgi:transposase-like protein
MPKILKIVKKINRKPLNYAKREDIANMKFDGVNGPLDTQFLLISALLPPAVNHFLAECEREVNALCGKRYEHGKTNNRWGSQEGSIVLANQRVAVECPRARTKDGKEIKLQTYQDFQNPEIFNQAVFNEGLKRVSQRDYEKGLPKIASSFGFKKSSISKRWIKATTGKLEELQNRDIHSFDIRAVFIDGKRFRKNGVVVAFGIGVDGKKYTLGIYQSDTENHAACLELLNALEKRGLPPSGLLFIVDGGSGLNKALDLKYACNDFQNRRAIRIRCFAHKWRNIEMALGENSHKALGLFWALRDAKDMAEAKAVSDELESVLKTINLSALESYLEAKADLLVIHELKLSKQLMRFFSTTNPIESLNSLLEEDMRRVKHWKDSAHFQRWLATYCLSSEKRMHRVQGFRGLAGLWILLRTKTEDKQNLIDTAESVA